MNTKLATKFEKYYIILNLKLNKKNLKTLNLKLSPL